MGKFALADALKSALHNAGCFGERRDVKFALAQLTPKERALLMKLVKRSAKRYG